METMRIAGRAMNLSVPSAERKNDFRKRDIRIKMESSYSKYTPEQRKATADIMNANLLMVEIMMANVMQQWINRAVALLEENGLMRQNIKRKAKELLRVSTDLMKRCNQEDVLQVKTFADPIYHTLTDSFLNEGGTVTQSLQASFSKKHGNRMELLFAATKNVMDKARIPNSLTVSAVQMVSMLAHSGIDIYEFTSRKVDALLEGIATVQRIKSRHNEQILSAAKDILRGLGLEGMILNDEDAKGVRTLAKQFNQSLVEKNALNMVESGITAMQVKFIEFVIGTLRIKMERKELGREDFRILLNRMGNKKNVRRMLEEVAAIPLPEGDADMFDYIETFPPSKEEGALSLFRRLCLEGKVMMEEETTEEKERRVLRRFVYRKGMLDMTYLRFLYWRFGTKKAVSDYLEKGGDTFARTRKKLKYITCEQLALKPDKKYRMDMGSAIRSLRVEKGITPKKLSASLGLRNEEDLWKLESISDAHEVSPEALKPVTDGIAKLFDVLPAYVIFLSLCEDENRGCSVQGILKHLKIYFPECS